MTWLRRLTPTICAFHLGFSLDPFWQWVAMKQARENQRGDFIQDTRVLIHVGKNPGSRLWSACDEARREYRKLCRQ